MDDDEKKDSRTKWSVYDTVRFKDCNGSLRCPNPNCPFILKFEERNRLKINSSRIFELCDARRETVACPARKYTAYISEKKARSFHIGTHTCKTKFVNNRPKDLVAATISVDPKIKPSQIKGKAILTAIQKRKSRNEVENVAKHDTDKRAISSEKINQRQPYGEGYVAIREYELYTDEKDPILIYSLNQNEQKVLKTSRSKMMIANEVDMDDQHHLSNEYCFFDGKVKKCKNFVTFIASFYHPMLENQLPLATMECKSEDSANIGRFWNNFNKPFKDVTKTGKTFSPVDG